jgi:hypothetical protein
MLVTGLTFVIWGFIAPRFMAPRMAVGDSLPVGERVKTA